MNLQCPTCLKPLTVPDQYAGQMMKCPLCANTFTVPPQGGTEALPPMPPVSPTPGAEASEPVSTPASSSGTVPTPTPPPPSPAGTSSASTTPTSTPSAGYDKKCVVYFSPEVMRWFAPVALVLIFVLQMFPWVGIYPGGVAVITQGAWGAAFGAYDEDDYLIDNMYGKNGIPEDETPGVSPLLIFYVLLFLPTLLVTVAVLLLDLGVVSAGQLPPAVQPLLRWRWAAVAGLNLIVFLFLGLQILLGFSVESKVINKATEATNKLDKKPKEKAIAYGTAVAVVSRTYYLWIAFWLHVLAVIGAWTAFCLHDRPGKPLPKLELEW